MTKLTANMKNLLSEMSTTNGCCYLASWTKHNRRMHSVSTLDRGSHNYAAFAGLKNRGLIEMTTKNQGEETWSVK